MSLIVTVPVTQEPVTLPEVKEHLRLEPDYDLDDVYLSGLISQAREFGEFETRRSFGAQTIQALIDVPMRPSGPLSGAIGFRASMIEVPMPPINDILSLEGETTPGTFQIIDPVNYITDTVTNPGRIYLLASAYSFLGSQWTLWIGPYQPRFRITFTCGYGPVIPFPYTLKRALLELIAFWYDFRQGRDETLRGTQAKSGAQIPPGIGEKFDLFRVHYA